MAGKNVKSDDPRKPKIVAALKRKYNVTKITLLKEVAPGFFKGQILARGAGRAFEVLGEGEVTAVEAGLDQE